MHLIADNLHGLNPEAASAMKSMDPEPIRELVGRCEKAGAEFIDVNPGYLSRRNEDRMEFLVEVVQETTSAGLVLDSPNPRLLARGLAACRSTPILNGLSLEPRKLEEILPLAVEHGTPLVILLMDEVSFVPPSVEEKLALALDLRERALAAGMSAEDLIFDPVLPNLSWDDAYARVAQDIQTVRLLSSGAVFQEPTRTMAGLSNLRSGGRDRYPSRVEQVCLSMLAGAGLTYALANVLDVAVGETVRTIKLMS
ncbi:MAG: dihydropteroate synthase [Desulfomonilaceae bacterium]|nr:dihydropteroate synthase [Desulfomonilaceae bacterium]